MSDTNMPAHAGRKMVDAARERSDAAFYRAMRARCRAVERDPGVIGVYSMGERCAVALILNRIDLLPKAYDTALQAVGRLDAGWLAMCMEIQRDGWAQA